MTAGERVRLGETSSGKCARGRSGEPVDLPVAAVAEGRGFVAGEPRTSPSDTAGLLARALAERDHGVLVVDDTGGYPASLADHEVLHVGGSRACDLWFSAEMADSVARMAFEGPVVVLDRSTYRDEAEADEAVAAVARRLFSIAADRQGSVLAVVEGIEGYLPADGTNEEAGRILRRIVRRGESRGLGVCGISRRPADVDRGFLDQCDWRLWHRLTKSRNATVVRRQIDGEHSSAVREFDDREAFLVEDDAGVVRRITVGDGIVPPGEDAGRPSTDESRERTDRLAALCDRIDELDERLAALEADLPADSEVDVADELDGLAGRVADRVADRLEVEGNSVAATTSSNGTDTGSDRRSVSKNGDGASGTDADEGAMAAFGAMMDSNGSEPEGSSSSESNGSGPSTRDDSAGDGLAALAGVGTSTGNGATTERSPDRDSSVSSGGTDEPSVPSIPSVGSQMADFERGADAGVLADVSAEADDRPAVVGRIEAALAALDRDARMLLTHYREEGPTRPDDAFRAATGSPDRVTAYTANRELREAGLIEHVGRGYYDYCLADSIAAGCDDDRAEGMAETYTRDVEQEHLETAG